MNAETRALGCLAVAVMLGGAAATKTVATTSPMPATATTTTATTTGSAPGQARAETPRTGLHRCISADGIAIFTDRACGDLEATDAPPPGAANLAPAVIVRVRSCARNQDDLLYGVRSALEAHDPNKLAEYYHWTGMGNSEGYRLMGRLANFSERPLLDVQLVSSAQEGAPIPPLPPPPELADEFSIDPAPAAPVPAPRNDADLLRVDQMRSETDYESQVTYFRLRSNAGCWWLQF